MSKRQYFHILALLGFSVLLSIGLFHNGFQFRFADYLFCAIILLFLGLIVRQLLVWNIVKISDTEVQLNRCFGLSKVHLTPQKDLLKVEADVEYKTLSDFEIATHIRVHTTKGTFPFYSRDYTHFDREIQILLHARKDLLLETNRQLQRKRHSRKDLTWIYLVLAIILLIVSWLRAR